MTPSTVAALNPDSASNSRVASRIILSVRAPLLMPVAGMVAGPSLPALEIFTVALPLQ
ncbi:hypothetical protein [Arthrobacter sp. MA-N2]|uniref:hypothetical protein n=1 Tax=Arthrobacter sp. MA-N2 TaxID=1101188 RepID=UPI0004B20BCE|nr:hypothetical protein [Arthrobacter sp. MA-N2]